MNQILDKTLAHASARLQDAADTKVIQASHYISEHPERLPSTGMEQLFKPLDYPEIKPHLNERFKSFATG